MNKIRQSPKVGIIGFGRFGPVLVRMLTPAHEVVVYDIADVAERARSAGVRAAEWQEVTTADTVFLAVPIRRLKEVVARLQEGLRPGTTVIDVCSVKVYPATVMREHFGPEITSIATHPLFGPDSATEGFTSLKLMMAPVSARNEKFEYWNDYFQSLGLDTLLMTPEEHDRLAARSQGITHFIGRVLEEFGIAHSEIDTEGFRDLYEVMEQTRHDTMELFQDLENFNPYTMEMVGQLIAAVERVEQKIIRRD
ncbi:MAG: prephenate dehydrogenase/arogenate dehydrogenase family protein [Candidatus Neomarinimicrobiota bacterium]